MADAIIIGAGPAGLMTAETIAQAGYQVDVFDAKPTAARKFLMAGKSGLNLTMNRPTEDIIAAYWDGRDALASAIRGFDAQAVMGWAENLGQSLFTGPTGRVFPKAMKASPLLRAWLARLSGLGVNLHTRWRWRDGIGGDMVFDTPQGGQTRRAPAVIFALGGASWPDLGSDGNWANIFASAGLPITPFAPSNMGLICDWSVHMQRHFGAPLKSIGLSAGDLHTRGEAVLTKTGLEGGGIYMLSPALRSGADLIVDLLPDLSLGDVQNRLARPRAKQSQSNFLRKVLGLDAVKQALLMECAKRAMHTPADLAQSIKALRVPYTAVQGLPRAISSAGGLPFAALDANLGLRDHPGVFCAGEMLDWDAPTGGYLLTACFATGVMAGKAAVDYLNG